MPPITPFLKGEGKKDLSTKAGVEIAPSSSILTPLPCGEAPDAPTSDRYTCRPAEHRRRAPARAPQARVLARTQTPAAPPRLTPRASRARTNFPVSRQRRQTVGGEGRGATLVLSAELRCRWDPPSCIRTWVQTGSKWRPGGTVGRACARGWRHRGAAAGGQPRRASSRRARARATLGLPAWQQLQ